MKKLILSILLALITITGFSHHLVNQCWYQGRYSIEIVDGPIGGTAHVTLIQNTGVFDTVINITANHQVFTVPQPSQQSPVSVWVEYSDGITNQIWTNSTQCNPLAINQIEVKSSTNSFGETEIWITVDDDVNVKEYRITDRKTGKIYKILIPDIRVGRKTYYVILK